MPNSNAERFRIARGSELPMEEMERLDVRLARLGRGVGAMRLRVGEGLLKLDGVDGVKALGYPNIESYCREALGRTGRWGTDVRGLARRLSVLPKLRAALVSGRLTSSMVELVARVATPLDEGEWIERAATMTVRAMRAELTRRRSETIDDTAPERVSIQTTVNQLDAWAFERAKLMVEANYEPEPEIEWASEAADIDARLRLAAQDLVWRDLELAVLGKRCEEHMLWLHFGYWSWSARC